MKRIQTEFLTPRTTKKCVIRVEPPKGNRIITFRNTAKPQHHYNDESMEIFIKRAADFAEQAWPGETFRLVTLRFGQYKLVYIRDGNAESQSQVS